MPAIQRQHPSGAELRLHFKAQDRSKYINIGWYLLPLQSFSSYRALIQTVTPELTYKELKYSF